MTTIKRYKVAGHIFAIECNDDERAVMTNYKPFITEDSANPLFTLHVGSEHTSAITEHVFTDASDDDMPRIEVSRTAEGWLIEESVNKSGDICLHIYTNNDFSEAWLAYETPNKRFAIDNAAMLIYAFAGASHKTLEMHSSVTVKDGSAYMFLGRSGTGKSTHSRQWQTAFPESWLLNDDNPIVRINDDGTVMVYGSPWSGKTPCYKNACAPVRAFVKLVQAPYNKIHKLRLPEAYAYILSSSSGLKIVPEMMDQMYATIAEVIQKVSSFGLECLPDVDAAHTCLKGIDESAVVGA